MGDNMFNSYKIIDLQSPSDYKLNHIKGSINIPYNELMNNYRRYLNKNDKYKIYFNNDILSKRVVAVLSYLGYNVISI